MQQKPKVKTFDFGQSEMDYPAPSKENNYLKDFGFKNGYKSTNAGNKGKLVPKKNVPIKRVQKKSAKRVPVKKATRYA